MKRNMDLIREILLAIEEQHEYGPIYGLTIPGYSINEIAYHCQLLYELSRPVVLSSSHGIALFFPIHHG